MHLCRLCWKISAIIWVTLLGRYIDHDHVWHTCPAIELKGFDVPGYEVKNICFKDVVLEDNGGPEQNIPDAVLPECQF